MTSKPPLALIAEDEPLLALSLQQELARAWPELQIAATVGDGNSAVAQALALLPDVLFFDIRMPGQSGLEAAAELADDWPAAKAFPALVFVTAYDQYALQAFETQAIDYVVKPVQPASRLRNWPSVASMSPPPPGARRASRSRWSRSASATASAWCRSRRSSTSRPPTSTSAC
jgi:CheY-like chemotaxis protein